ncbi:MAG: hypothetical protein QNJ55_07165 [Xenococcus sp. MO_188.B8]|nr:hypothetical protein [Xenococcus sp. MO_188.B8]
MSFLDPRRGTHLAVRLRRSFLPQPGFIDALSIFCSGLIFAIADFSLLEILPLKILGIIFL